MIKNKIIQLTLTFTAFTCFGCTGYNADNTTEETDSIIEPMIEELECPDVEEDSFEVKPFVLLSETLSADGSKTQFIVQIPEKYTSLDLHIMLSRLKQKCKKTEDYDVSFFVKGAKLDDAPYAAGYVEGETYSVDVLSEIEEEEAKKLASNKIKRECVGKWPIGSPDQVMTIFRYQGKYYLEFQLEGNFTGDRVEMVRSKSHPNVFKFKNPDDGDETYEIVKGGMYAIEEDGSKMFFPSIN